VPISPYIWDDSHPVQAFIPEFLAVVLDTNLCLVRIVMRTIVDRCVDEG
jgi:hypothetical protein